jgi:predicted deacetylase
MNIDGSKDFTAEAHGAEFVGLDDEETRRAVDAGWRVLKLAGVEPDGFVAPAYAYTPALRRVVSPSLIRTGSLLCSGTLRLDLHPSDLQHPRHMLALEWVLGRTARQRQAITFQEIVCAERPREGARVLAPQA